MNEATPATAPHFHVFGVPVRVELFFFLIPLISLTNRDVPSALIWTALVFLGVMVHELGHALTMRSFGFAPSITLHGLGGLTHFPAGARPTPKQNFFITLAGPGVGLIVGFVAFGVRLVVSEPHPLLETALDDAMWINIGWSIVNLFPLLPWDGGLLLDSGLAWATGKRRHFAVGATSLLGGAAVLVLAVKLRAIFLGYFGFMGVLHGWNFLKAGNAAKADEQRGGSWWERLHAGEDIEAELRAAIAQQPDPTVRAQLAELLAWACLKKRDWVGARQAVAMMGAHRPSNSLRARLAAADDDAEGVIRALEGSLLADADLPLLVSALISKERYADVVKLGLERRLVADVAATRLFEAGAFAESLTLCTAERERTGDPRFAYNEACCLCRLGRLDEAVAALQRAKGTPHLAQLLQDDDLAPIRERPEVRALLTQP